MSDNSTGHSICYKLTCGAVVAGEHQYCPQCGGRMKSERTVRRLGWFLVAVGIFLAGLLGYIIAAIGPALTAAMTDAGAAADGSRFDASASAASGVMRLLWVIFGFGVFNFGNGLYQGISGRRSRVMSILVLLGALAIIGLAVMTVGELKTAA